MLQTLNSKERGRGKVGIVKEREREELERERGALEKEGSMKLNPDQGIDYGITKIFFNFKLN
jgi:hypothetical protein